MRVFVDVMAVFQGQLEMKSFLLKKNWTKDEGSLFNASQSCDKECTVLRQRIHRQANDLKDLPN